jgi:S1-C subfamily serine protease
VGRQAQAQSGMPAELLAKVGDSVVRLSMDDGGRERGNGTGFVVGSDGVVVTNHHVVEDVSSALVAIFRDGTRRRVLGSLALDEPHDLALLRLEPGRYPALSLAPAANVGQPVFLIGSSWGLDQSLGTGIVSALRPDGFPAEWRRRYEQAGRKVVVGPIVQHTAASAPGSSGAPLVDLEGRVVAVHHSGMAGFPIFFGAHTDALRSLLARTDLAAPPTPFARSVGRNLLLSAAFFGALLLLLGVTTFVQRRRQRPPGGWQPGR